jgi:hypothetical protein
MITSVAISSSRQIEGALNVKDLYSNTFVKSNFSASSSIISSQHLLN